MTAPITWFQDLGRADTATVGGKGANLGEMAGAGLPVPPGFVVTAAAYLDAMDEGGVRADLIVVFDEARTHVDDLAALEQSAERLRALVRKAGVPPTLREPVLAAYHQLGTDVAVAVRSSATAEDAADTSFAGMHETFANVVGDAAVLERLVDCWASLYGERVITYRASRELADEPVIAVVVQQMVESERSGVLFCADPSTGDRDRMVIEGALGLGEVVVSGQVEPDTYILAKDGPRIVSVRIGHQTHKLVFGPNGTVQRVDLDPEQADARVLTDAEAIELARLGLAVEAHYGEPQDVEWAIAGGKTYLVQTRPITTLGTSPTSGPTTSTPTAPPLLQGLAASSGMASGRVRVLLSPKEGNQLLDGEVLVAPMTNPDWVPTIRRAAAVVTDGGGMTCHAAIVSRELGVPCVVGARTATSILRDGELVTVDGALGTVHEGGARAHPGGECHRGRRLGAGRRHRAARHSALRQPRHPRPRRGGCRPARRRRRSAARRVHAHGGPRGRPPQGAPRPWWTAGVPRLDVGVTAPHHPSVRAAARSCTGRWTSARTSSVASRVGRSSSRSRRTR